MENKIWKINQFYGGFALDDKLGLPSQCADTSRHMDIYSEPGKLRPNKLVSDSETGATDAAISAFWAASDNKVYALGRIGGEGADANYTRLYVKADANAVWTTAMSDSAGTVVGGFLREYKDYLYFWTNSNTIARYGTISSSPSFGDDQNNITVSDHYGPAIEQKDTLFVAYDNKLASYDGTTWTDEAFDLPTGWVIESLANWGKYIVIGGYYKSGYKDIGRLFFWDTSATSWEFAKDCPAGKLIGIRNIGDKIVGLTFNNGIDSSDDAVYSIFEWIGGSVKVVKRIVKKGVVLVANDITTDSELDTKGNVFYFAANIGSTYRGLYSWGEPIPGQPAFIFDRHLRVTTETISYIKTIKFIGSYLFCSLVDSSTGTDYVITKTINALNYSAAGDGTIYDSLVFDGGKPYMTKEIDKIILNAKPLPTNTVITLSYKVDRASSWTTIGTWTTATETQKSFHNVSGATFDKFKELQLRVGIQTTTTASATPEITDITTLYKEVSISNK